MFRLTHIAIGLSVIFFTAACTSAPSTTTTQPAAATAAPKPTSAPAISASPSVAISSASPAAVASPSPAVVAPAPSVAASPSSLAVVGASPAAASASVTGLRLVAVQPGALDSTVTVENDGATADDLSGWSLVIGTVSIRLPANANVEPGGRLVLHTGSGPSTGQDVYLAQDMATLASAVQPGASVALHDVNGTAVTQTTIP